MEPEQVRTERDEKSFRHHDVLSPVLWPFFIYTSSEDSSEEFVSKLQFLNEDSRKVSFSVGPSFPVAEVSPLARELVSQVEMKEIERVAVAAVVDASKLKLYALLVWCAELDSEVTRSHSEFDVFKRLRGKITGLGRDDEKTAASLTNTASMRDEAIKRPDNLHAQLGSSVRREDAYKSEPPR